jgi:hypothetical protein
MRLIATSTINDASYGYNEEMLFKLDNGQIWIQAEYKYNYNYSYRPEVKIYTDNINYYLQLEDMDEYVVVRKVDNYFESIIVSEFNGWRGDTIFKLQNGQVWKQSQYNYLYHYAYNPRILIYNDGYKYMMKVDGIENKLPVIRIK